MPQGHLPGNLTRVDSRGANENKSARASLKHTPPEPLETLTLGRVDYAFITLFKRRKPPALLTKNGQQTMRVFDFHHRLIFLVEPLNACFYNMKLINHDLRENGSWTLAPTVNHMPRSINFRISWWERDIGGSSNRFTQDLNPSSCTRLHTDLGAGLSWMEQNLHIPKRESQSWCWL